MNDYQSFVASKLSTVCPTGITGKRRMNAPASLSFPTTPETAILPACIVEARPEVSGSPVLSQSVGAVLLRRIKYIGRWLYWAARHRSTKHVAWVLAFEGFSWH